MIKLLWRTDIHLSEQTPRSRTDDWTETVLGKIRQVGEIASRYEVDAVIDGGDFFDVKSPIRNSHSLVRRAIEAHKDYPCPVYANVGNHDCVYGDYRHLPQQPLGVLFESGVFKRLYDEHELILQKGNTKVRVVGVPYHGTRYDLSRFRNIKRNDEDHLVCAAHVLAAPVICQMFDAEDIMLYDNLDLYEPTSFLFGHWHKDQDIMYTPFGKAIINIGSLTRGSLNQDNVERTPSVVIMEFGKKEQKFTKVPLVCSPPSVVFDIVKKEAEDLKDESMDEFMGKLKEMVLPPSTMSFRDTVTSMDGIPDIIKEKTISYIERAGGR